MIGKISIIIPTYKRVEQTLKTIRLLLNSEGFNTTYKAEIIISDSSPSQKLKESLKKSFGNTIIYTRPKKPGIAANKNWGAKTAQYPLLVFCDSDMEVEKNTLTNTIKALKNNPTAGAVGGQVVWKGGPKDKTHDRPRKEDRMITINKTTYVEAIYSRYMATYKDIFWQVGGYDETVFNMRGEGSDLSIRYWRAGYPLIYDSSIVVHHVHKVQGGIIRNTTHPEWGIAKDLFLLAYKYDIFDNEYHNFAKTVRSNFKSLPDGYYQIVQGIGKYLNFIVQVKPEIDRQKKQMKPKFNFRFLEIFSQEKLFQQCIHQAEKRISPARKILF